MEPFSIVCPSCASKLKVTKPSAIGQVLACPNCGTMIKVAPPKGWVAPQASANSLSDLAVAPEETSFGGDFDDIDAILGSPTAAQPKPTTAKPKSKSKSKVRPTRPAGKQNPNQPAQPRAKGKRKPAPVPSETSSGLPDPPAPRQGTKQRTRPIRPSNSPQPNAAQTTSTARPTRPTQRPQARPNTATSADPILPTDQWTGEGTRKRKKLVLAIVGILGTLMLLGAIGVAVALNLQKPEVEVAGLEVDQEEKAAPPEVANGPLDLAKDDPEQKLDEEPAGPIEVLEDDNLLEEDNLMAEEVEKPKIEAPNVIETMNKQPEGFARPGAAPMEEGALPAAVEPAAPVVPQDPTAEKTQDPAASPFASVKKEDPNSKIDIELESNKNAGNMIERFNDDLGELSLLLEESGTSLLEIKDLTSLLRSDSFVGLPKYVVEKPDPLRLDLDKLDLNVGGLKYEQITLSRVLRNLTAISGIPITLNARSIVRDGKESNPRIDTLIADSDLGSAIDKIIEPFGLTKFVNDSGITVGIEYSPETVTEKHDVSGLPRMDRPQKLLSYIQTMIQPNIWVDKAHPSSLRFMGNHISAKCNKEAHLQIERLFSKMKASAALTKDPDDAAAKSLTRSRWNSIEAKLERSPNLNHGLQTDLGSFLTKLESNTSITVLIDWINVSDKGWNQHTIVPGTIRESSVAEVVEELCHAMKLSAIALDENTMVLTTPEAAAQTFDLEVYPVQGMISAGFDEEKIIRLVEEALGRQVHFKIFDAQCQCLIVAAPQAVQRQAEALLDRVSGK